MTYELRSLIGLVSAVYKNDEFVKFAVLARLPYREIGRPYKM